MSELTITVKTSGDKKYELSVSPELTVGELKQLVAAESGIAADQQRLIFSGRILKDHEPLSQYNMKTGNFIHLVKGAARKPAAGAAAGASAASGGASTGANSQGAASIPAAPTTLAAGQVAGNPLSDLTGARYSGLANLPSASLFGPDGGQGAMPSMGDFNEILSQNPEALEQAIDMIASDSSPFLANIPAEQRRQMAAVLRSPATRALLMDPDVMGRVAAAQNEMRAMGFDASAFGGAAGAGAGGAGGAGAANAAGADLFGGLGNPSENGRNPFMPDPALAARLFGGVPAASVPEDTRPPEERYEAQLRQLNELGFFDFDRNVRALRRSGGNVNGAVEALLDGQV